MGLLFLPDSPQGIDAKTLEVPHFGRDLDTNEDMRGTIRSETIVELGDLTVAHGLAELEETAGTLRNPHSQECLPLSTDLGTLCDVTQTVEVDVCATVDSHEVAAGGVGLVLADRGDG